MTEARRTGSEQPGDAPEGRGAPAPLVMQPKAVIVVDDTRPATHASSIADLDHHVQLRTYLHFDDERWMGDVYKLVWWTASFMPT